MKGGENGWAKVNWICSDFTGNSFYDRQNFNDDESIRRLQQQRAFLW